MLYCYLYNTISTLTFISFFFGVFEEHAKVSKLNNAWSFIEHAKRKLYIVLTPL